MDRLSWQEYGLVIAQAAATRSEDPWHKVGAVAFRPDNSVAGVGYNGPPSGIEINWDARDDRHPFIIHAEINALRWTDPQNVRGGWLASTREPCSKCLTSIAAYGINRVLYLNANREAHKVGRALGIVVQRQEAPWVKLGIPEETNGLF